MHSGRHYAHVIRVVGVFAIGFLAFLVVRHLLIPPDFGVHGFYRAGALDDARARPVAYAGRETCETCHEDAAGALRQGRHAAIGCEGCHGALASHAGGTSDEKPALPDTRRLCATCHTRMAGKYNGFPQVDPATHAGDVACATCHVPHRPAIGSVPPTGSR